MEGGAHEANDLMQARDATSWRIGMAGQDGTANKKAQEEETNEDDVAMGEGEEYTQKKQQHSKKRWKSCTAKKVRVSVGRR